MGPRRRGITVPPTQTETEALAVAYDVLVDGARATGAAFTEPDDDWAPMWLVLTQSQGTLLTGNADKYTLTDQVARTQVSQSFVNTGSVQMEVCFVFPLPYDGAIDQLTLLVDGKPPLALKPGDSYQVPPGAPHDARAGEKGAKVLAVYVVEKGKPLATPAP